MNSKQYLDHHKYKVQVVQQQETYFDTTKQEWKVCARWKDNQHTYRGIFSYDLCLMSVPDDLIVIEFEHPYIEFNKEFIKKAAKKCTKLGLQYGIYSHKGKSDYLYVKLNASLDLGSKKLITKRLVTGKGYKYLDKSNAGNTLVPIPYAPHWKHKHIHQFISGTEILQQDNKISKGWIDDIVAEMPPSKETKPYKIERMDCSPISTDRIKKILDTDFKVQRIIYGNHSYPSPSEARLALLDCLVAYKLSDSEIHYVMSMNNNLHWDKTHLNQREIGMARQYVTKERILYD